MPKPAKTTALVAITVKCKVSASSPRRVRHRYVKHLQGFSRHRIKPGVDTGPGKPGDSQARLISHGTACT